MPMALGSEISANSISTFFARELCPKPYAMDFL